MNIYADGSGTNGITCSYCVLREDGEVIKHEVFEGLGGKATNNEMEYRAVIEALKAAKDGDSVSSDSQLVVYQVLGAYKVKEPHLKPLAEKARKLLESKDIRLQWVKRDNNVAGRYLEKH